MQENVKSAAGSASGTITCSQCGACCVAPDISSLGKAEGAVCPHLQPDNRCDIYDDRPLVCRQYQADEICLEIEAPTLQERIARFQDLFGLKKLAESL
jgi:uncharacterized protein